MSLKIEKFLTGFNMAASAAVLAVIIQYIQIAGGA